MACSKQFSITIDEGGSCSALFEDTVWQAPVINTNGGTGNAHGTAAIFGGSSSTPGGVEGQFGDASIEGAVNYTGPEIGCCLAMSGSAAGVGGWTVIIWYDFGGPSQALLLGISESSFAASNPFTIPLSLTATAITIQFNVNSASGEDPFPGGNASATGTLGDCP